MNPTQVLLWHFNCLHYTNPTSLISDPTVHFSARTRRLHCIRRSAAATAASSCGRCASLWSWWLGRWSLSAHPEPHPAAPALSQPPGPGSLAAWASVKGKKTAHNPKLYTCCLADIMFLFHMLSCAQTHDATQLRTAVFFLVVHTCMPLTLTAHVFSSWMHKQFKRGKMLQKVGLYFGLWEETWTIHTKLWS